MKASKQTVLLVNKLFQKHFGRNVKEWLVNGTDLDDLSVKCPQGHPSASFHEAYRSSLRASEMYKQGIRVFHLENEGSFGIDLSDPDCIMLFTLLQTQGRKINSLLMCTV